jgi:pilus assembly protein Flp/PilA
MLAVFTRLLKNESGVTAIEYGLIAALIAVAAIVAMNTVGGNLSTTFNTIASSL